MALRMIEDVIAERFSGDMQKNALEFIAHLRASDIVLNDSDNYFWNGEYKGKGVCVINIELSNDGASFDTFINALPDAWDNNSASISERTKEIIWANVRPCDPSCDCGNKPTIDKIIFGKECGKLCGSFLGIYDPDAETFSVMKRIVTGLKNDIEKRADTA